MLRENEGIRGVHYPLGKKSEHQVLQPHKPRFPHKPELHYTYAQAGSWKACILDLDWFHSDLSLATYLPSDLEKLKSLRLNSLICKMGAILLSTTMTSVKNRQWWGCPYTCHILGVQQRLTAVISQPIIYLWGHLEIHTSMWEDNTAWVVWHWVKLLK